MSRTIDYYPQRDDAAFEIIKCTAFIDGTVFDYARVVHGGRGAEGEFIHLAAFVIIQYCVT